MFLKKLYMFLELSSPSACCIVDGFPRICLELVNLGHSRVMCLIVSVLSQSSQVGLSSFVIRCRCVKRECPIRVLVVTTSSCLDEDGGVFHGSIDGLISFNLFVFGVFSHESCQWFFVRLFIFVSASWNVILFISTELGDAIASLAALSASSLPLMPEWEGTHRNSIFFCCVWV